MSLFFSGLLIHLKEPTIFWEETMFCTFSPLLQNRCLDLLKHVWVLFFNYIDKILPIIDHLADYVDIYVGINLLL